MEKIASHPISLSLGKERVSREGCCWTCFSFLHVIKHHCGEWWERGEVCVVRSTLLRLGILRALRAKVNTLQVHVEIWFFRKLLIESADSFMCHRVWSCFSISTVIIDVLILSGNFGFIERSVFEQFMIFLLRICWSQGMSVRDFQSWHTLSLRQIWIWCEALSFDLVSWGLFG